MITDPGLAQPSRTRRYQSSPGMSPCWDWKGLAPEALERSRLHSHLVMRPFSAGPASFHVRGGLLFLPCADPPGNIGWRSVRRIQRAEQKSLRSRQPSESRSAATRERTPLAAATTVAPATAKLRGATISLGLTVSDRPTEPPHAFAELDATTPQLSSSVPV